VRTPQALSEAPVLALDGQGAARPALQVTQDDVLARLLAATQVGLTQDVETAQALAEKYELVTEHTNLLLVIERADADKTDGLPQLHQVVHMTPAGHSGTGRMRFGVDMRMSRSMGIVDTQEVWKSMSGPALYRSPIRRTGTDNVPFTPGGMDDFELPAFLRKQGVEIPRPSQILARTIIRTFHEALDNGLEYRQDIRVLANTKFDVPLEPAIDAAKSLVKSSLKAWSCFLLWASDKAGYTHGLTDQTLLLVMRQLSEVDEADQVEASVQIDQLLSSIGYIQTS
jgi:hypothetical protein